MSKMCEGCIPACGTECVAKRPILGAPKVREARKEIEDRLRGEDGFIHITDLDRLGNFEVAIVQQAVAAEREKYCPILEAVKEWKSASSEEAYRLACQKLNAISLEAL